MNERSIRTLGDFLFIIVGLLFSVILGTLCGAISGWIVGLFFGNTILGVLGQVGIHSITMSQFGAFMGFIGGFLKPSTKSSKSENDK